MITNETRRESNYKTAPNKANRHAKILDLLKIKPMTAHELTEQLLILREINSYDRNAVSPRLTELKEAGKVEVVAKKYCKRTDRQVAVWKLKEESNDNC